MPTTSGTEINAQLAETRANIETAIAQRQALAAGLAARGAPNVSTDASLSEVSSAALSLIDSLARGELTTVIAFHINPTGSDGYIPPSPILGPALKGAHILVEEVGSTNVWRIPISSIDNAVVTLDNTFTKPSTTLLCSVVLGTSGEDIRGRKVTAVVANAASVTVTLTTYLSDEATFEIGRVFPVEPADASSYLITATTSGGKRTERFGRFDSAGAWINETGIEAAVPELDPETGTVTSWANGPDNRDDFAAIWPWSAVRRETFDVTDAAGAVIQMDMAGFRRDAFYGVRIEERDVDFISVASDGSTSSVPKPCRILWIARPTLPGYEIPSPFYRKAYTENDAGGLALEMELADGLFLGAHKANIVTATFPTESGTERTGTLNSGTVGSVNSGASVQQFASYASQLNRLTVTDPKTGTVLPPDPTGRRWACTTLDAYMAFWPLFVVQFGLDAQRVFQGITTDAGGVAQSKAGVTDPLVTAGHLTGSIGAAEGFTPFLFLGIENYGYGSEGDTLADVSFFSGRDTDEDPLETRTFVQPDRSRITPNASDLAAVTANGYILLTTRDIGNSVTHLSGLHPNPAVRHLHMPTKEDDGFLNAKNCDTAGQGIYRTGQGTGKWILSNASLFGYRGAGFAGGPRAGVSSLGWVFSGYAPGFSHGAYFGSRVSLLL